LGSPQDSAETPNLIRKKKCLEWALELLAEPSLCRCIVHLLFHDFNWPKMEYCSMYGEAGALAVTEKD
jgi:hypothetical protein